jgi:hypothetical protein
MPRYSINQLAAMTGRDRRTVTARLDGLDYQEGEDNAHLFDSVDALAAIYLSKDTRAALDEKRVEEIELNMQIKRKARIPLTIVTAIWDAAIQAFTAQLKAAKGKPLTVAKINELLDKLRTAKLPLEW